MKKLNKNELGFGTVEIILVLIIVALLGVVGWFVYSNNNNASTSINSTPTTTQPKSTNTITVDPYAGWKVETNTKYKFTYKYPPSDSKYTWTSFVTENSSSSQSYQMGDYVNNAGVNLAIAGTQSGGGYQPFSFSIKKTGSTEDQGAKQWEQIINNGVYYKMKSKTTVTKNGINGTRWEYQSLNTANSDVIRYQFTKDGLTYHITIEGKTNGIDLLKYGEQIYSTFQFL